MINAQEKTISPDAFSPDSLLAALQKGSQLSLRGSEIRLSGVVIEIKPSKVTFKSSGSDRVICELSTPLAGKDDRQFVGSSLTVIGRVRGRGMLGNVTLEQCALVVPVVASREPVIPPLDAPRISPSLISPALPERPPIPLEVPKPSVAVTAQETSAVLDAAISTKRVPAASRPQVARTAVKTVVEDTEAGGDEPPTDTVKASEPPAEAVRAVEPPSESIKPASASNAPESYFRGFFHGFVALAIILAMLVSSVKLAPIVKKRFRPSPPVPSTEETRRAALEELLNQKKK